MKIYVDYFSAHMADYLMLVRQHLILSTAAVLFACLIGIPFGILTIRSKRTYQFITTIFSGLRIVPSLAVLILLIPVMGIGMKPALIALSVLAVPPVLIHTALGFGQVPPFCIEVAEGMGMSQTRLFFQVKFPLALPYIMTGIKTAVSEVIASATLAAYIGSGGLGVLIYNGISLMKTEYLLIGGISVACLTVLVNALIGVVGRQLFRYGTG